ncbi:DUF1223 domain-containing protein [Thioclava sp. BHET1]|nr:DUF1223 domain-containing protein [Thioclava sp. BHET1]
MRRIFSAATCVFMGYAGAALAQVTTGSHPAVVVELFTSQGCSTCPPADHLLGQLTDRRHVIPLALHVDYWDYIGWTDPYGQTAFTQRQKAYARAIGSRSIYTPQMVIDGVERIEGAHPMDVAELIQEHRADTAQVDLQLNRKGSALTVAATAAQPFDKPVNVQLVRYIPEKTQKILRGENAGETISYYNIVTEWKTLGRWDGKMPLALSETVSGTEPIVVILQEPGPGAILGAARLTD